MTDSDIIKALECCYRDSNCEGCQYGRMRNKEGRCIEKMQTDAIALIKRQQEEIERLEDTTRQLETDNFNANMNLALVQKENDNLIRNYKACAMEVVMDFAGRLKEKAYKPCDWWPILYVVDVKDIDALVAEMEGEK